ncbi:MAG: MMPL family transporter [Psychromonas sp.]
MVFCSAVLIQQTVFSNKWPIETNVLALLPENKQDKFAQKAFEQISDSMNNRVVFVLKGKNRDNLVSAAKHFTGRLSKIGLFAQVNATVSDEQQQAWGALYFPYRAQLLSEASKLNLQTNPEGRTHHVIQQVYNPFSGVSGQELKSDPFLLFRDYLNARSNSNNNFLLYQNYLLSQVDDNAYLLIQAHLAGDAYDSHLQSLLPQLQGLENDVEQQFHVKLLHTGTLFYAAYGTNSAKSEISTIGFGSLIGIMLLLLLVYRSALPLMLALLSIGCGLLVAFVCTVWVFGKVHLFSLVFGASLIGVSIDYAFHYLTERLVDEKDWHASDGLKNIFNAITLGLITSLIGYLGLLMAPFPGLQQLSLFSIVGLLCAYLTVVLCYPALAKTPSKTKQPNLAYFRVWLQCWQSKKIQVLLPSILVVLALVGLTEVHFDDDIRQLQAMPEALISQEKTIKGIVGVGYQQRLLLIKASSEELLLRRLEQLSTTFKQWQADGVIQSVQSVDQFIPSLQTQQQNYLQIKSLYEHQAEVLSEKLNFKEMITFKQSFKPLLMGEYLNSSVAKALGFLWLGEIEGQYATVVVLNDIKNPEHQALLVETYISQQSDITVLDKATEVSTIFAHYRVFIGEMLLAVYFLIALLLVGYYGAKKAFKVLLPPFVAGLVALAITAAFAIPITIFNLLALLLVLGIGIDYTLFFAEQKHATRSENTLLAITLSAITTVLSFGLLALSETQAIQGFGVTVLTGIIVAWLLAPFAMQNKREK